MSDAATDLADRTDDDPQPRPVTGPVEIRTSRVHGRGIHVHEAAAAGDCITSAAALVLDPHDTDALADHPLASYLVAWEDGAAVPMGPLAFVNHSSRPNAELVVDDDHTEVQLYLLRDVVAGEELTVDYGPDHPV